MQFIDLKLAYLLLAGSSLGVAMLPGADDIPPPSPFVPASGNTVQPKPDSSSGYEFVGVTATGAQTLVSIRRLSDQRSVWIPVGKTVAEITVVNYVPARDEVTIRAAETMLTLPLRNAARISGAVSVPTDLHPPLSPVAVPPAPPRIAPLSTQEEKEMEARMLVTDLLEIGQQQRKAYEEAQRRAASAKPPPAPTSSAPVPPPPAENVGPPPAPEKPAPSK